MAGAIDRSHRGSILLADGEVIAHDAYGGAQHVLRLACPAIAGRAQPGSFVHLRCDEHLPMRRPMSIMRADPRSGWIEMLYKVHGAGTARLAQARVGDTLSVLGPIGQGFRLQDYRRRPLLLGGGVGIPPMVFLADHLRRHARETEPLVLMGSEVDFPFRPRPSRIMVPGVPDEVIASMPLLDDWGIASRLTSQRTLPGCFSGYITDLARQVITHAGEAREEIEIFACGPTPMLRAVQDLAAAFSLPCQLSLEEYMACAVGGCAGCTVQVTTTDGVAMKRVCVDGPVFEAASVNFAP